MIGIHLRLKQEYILYIVKLKLDVVHITQLGSFSFSHYLKKIISLQQTFTRLCILSGDLFICTLFTVVYRGMLTVTPSRCQKNANRDA